MGDLPPKLFFRIGEVAGLVGVEPHVLRYWEREFRSIRPTKSAKGQRVYSRKDVENLLRVRDLLYRDGFTIAGAKKKLTSPTGATAHAERDEPDVDTDSSSELEESIDTPRVEQASGRTTPLGVGIPRAGVQGRSPCDEDTRSTRDKLVALRDEVESFIAELSRR